MKILNTKLIRVFFVVLIVGFILGIILYFLTNDMEKISISSSLINYVNMIKNSSFNYSEGLLSTLVYNLKFITLIWLCGIVFILVFVCPVLLFAKGVLVGFSLVNIISVFKLKGILYGFIFSIPTALNIFILILMAYYSTKFASKTYKNIKHNTSVNLKQYIKNYSIIYIILSFATLIVSLFEVYVISNLLKLVI